jgi:hypothetical protein
MVSRAGGSSNSAAEIRQDFETVLDLWREGRYADLYYRTVVSGKQTKESLVRKMSAAERRPACCWEKLQDVRISDEKDDSAVLHARLGIENGAGMTEYCTRSFRMRREEGVWKPALSDILALAGAGHKRRTYHR